MVDNISLQNISPENMLNTLDLNIFWMGKYCKNVRSIVHFFKIFLVILKLLLQNYQKTLKKCFSITCMFVTGSLTTHQCVTICKGLIASCHLQRVNTGHQTCLEDFVVDLKHTLQIYNKVFKACLVGTSYTMNVSCSQVVNEQIHCIGTQIRAFMFSILHLRKTSGKNLN